MEGEDAEKKRSKELEVEIKNTILARLPDFKAQADLLTFEGVRRAVETDIGMEPFSLDAHKKFIKRCLEECFSADDGEKAPEPSGRTNSEAEKSTKEAAGIQNSSELKNEDAPDFDETHASDAKNKIKKGIEVSEDMIKEEIKKRASFIKNNLETISLRKVRELLEQDLNLGDKALVPYKGFISTELDKVLQSLDMNKSENGVHKNKKKAPQKVEKPQACKASKRTREELDPSESASEEEEHCEEVKPKRRKQAVYKVKASTKNTAGKKSSVEEKNKSVAPSKVKKTMKTEREENSDEEREGGDSSDKSESRSSVEEKDVKKKEKPTTQVYGKRVEQLKSIIKSCGLSIPPAAYKRAKQAPEDKRDAFLIKELEEILRKEGLSTNPSEKEIKDVKKRKERAKELEGIDTSNIITSSRRRSSAFSFIPPPKPPKIESSSDDEVDDDEDDDDDDIEMEKIDDDDDDNGRDEGNDDDGDEGQDSGREDGDESN